MDRGGVLPLEEAHRDTEPNHTRPKDIEINENEEGWSFGTDFTGVQEHFSSYILHSFAVP